MAFVLSVYICFGFNVSVLLNLHTRVLGRSEVYNEQDQIYHFIIENHKSSAAGLFFVTGQRFFRNGCPFVNPSGQVSQ